jgi:glycosidase
MILAYFLMSTFQDNETDHAFVYRATEKLQKVNIAGSFNGWNKDADPLTPSLDGMTWTKHFKLKPGSYTYKFVLNGDKWILDPAAAKNVDDGNGNTNSQLLIAPAGFEKPAKIGDGIITVGALKHLTEVPFFNYDRGKLTLSLQTRPNDIASIKVAIDGVGTFPLADEGGDEFFERYVAHIPWDRKHDVQYRFILNDGNGSQVFGPKGLTISGVGNSFVVKASTYQPFEVPSWVEHSVIYHIFPDRFAKGDVPNPPTNLVPWGSKPNFFSYQGGNIAGIEEHLSYLKDLGISAVFLNPIFKSPVYHRYETSDYHLIDPIFGTNQEFKELTHKMKQNGMRVILDGVFNHTATSFFPFADVVKNGAESKYTGWYTFKSFPVKIGENPNYVAWFNYPSLPKVNYDSQGAADYMLGVPKFWNENADISAWRLDAANEVTSEYWKKFRKTVKALDKDMWIVGEVWGDGSPWLKGDQWDSVMNYQFRAGVLDFVTKKGSGKASVLLSKLMNVYNSYAPQVSRNMMNLIGSHDTARILTLCEGDAGLAKLAAIIQFTWVGAPSVYYGDELGMQGGADPDNRRAMTWDVATPDNSFLQLYKKLIRVRNSDLVLQSGDPLPLLADDAKQVAAFARVLGDKADIVAINRSAEPETIDLNLSTVAGLPKSTVAVSFTDALSGETISPSKSILHLRLAPRSAAVLIPRSGNSSHFSLSRLATVGGSTAMSSNPSPKEPL